MDGLWKFLDSEIGLGTCRGPANGRVPIARRPARVALALVCTCGVALGTGCQQKMARQPSFKPYDECRFFADGRSARPLIVGTVARGQLRIDTALSTGRSLTEEEAATRAASAPESQGSVAQRTKAAEAAEQSNEVDVFPIPVTRDLIEHGRHRYMIFCAVCHDALGTGHGKIVERGYTKPPSYHIDRLRNAPVGHFFAVMTEGYGSMPSYAAQIPVADRWAIAAYLRALQLSQHFPVDKLPPNLREEWARARSVALAEERAQ